tara:strand:+ start:4034 stop:4351 length:318 start_codon:yes stop_codon:yes gene_type:complete
METMLSYKPNEFAEQLLCLLFNHNTAKYFTHDDGDRMRINEIMWELHYLICGKEKIIETLIFADMPFDASGMWCQKQQCYTSINIRLKATGETYKITKDNVTRID